MIPESRRDQGLVMQLPIAENVALTRFGDHARLGVVSRGRLLGSGRDMIERLDIRALDARTPVGRLSGGNQQKTMFAKWVRLAPSVLIIDEPTRGVDIGAKQGIYRLIASMAREGAGILLISSELEEVIGLSHRVLVMSRGRLVRELTGAAINEDDVMAAAFDLDPDHHETAS
jgi:ABC-type sugar transport system ATPase subunit